MPKAHRSGVPNPSRGSPGQTLCRHCRRLLSTLEHYSGDYCSAPRCREQHLQDQLEAFRDDTARLVEEPEPTRYAIVVIPHRTSELVPIEPERRRALDDRLSELAAILPANTQRLPRCSTTHLNQCPRSAGRVRERAATSVAITQHSSTRRRSAHSLRTTRT